MIVLDTDGSVASESERLGSTSQKKPPCGNPFSCQCHAATRIYIEVELSEMLRSEILPVNECSSDARSFLAKRAEDDYLVDFLYSVIGRATMESYPEWLWKRYQ